MVARRGVRLATTTEVIGDGDCGGGGRVKTMESVDSSTRAGDTMRRTNSGETAGASVAMFIVAAAVGGLDVRRGRDREGRERKS